MASIWASASLAQETQEVLPTTLKSQPIPEGGQTTSKDGAADQGQNKEPASEKLSPSLDRIEAAIRDLVAQERAAQGQGPKDEEIRDLEAQEGMAFWAETMFWATIAAVLLTFAGIVLIGRTLIHTRHAAEAARDMVTEGKKTTIAAIEATSAAVDANRIAREMSERQLRAYLLPAKPTVEMRADGTVEAIVPLGNGGQTPAKQCRTVITVHVLQFPYSGHIIGVPGPDKYRSRATIRSGGQAVLIKTKAVSLDQREAIARKEMAIYVSGGATYLDVFDEPRTTKFRLFYRGQWGGTQGLDAAHEGNEFT